MRSLFAFTKKEMTEQIRSGRALIMVILFVAFGIMNPAVAKMTPWLLETFADAMADSGMIIVATEVSALDSWMQFFKNIPMALIAFVLLQSSSFTREYQTGTLVLSLTKGLERFKVVASKAFVISLCWTVGYWICFWVTYLYNAYFWDNSVAHSLWLSAVCWWLFGMWVISLMIFFSTASKANTGVLVSCGGVVFVTYLLGLVPKIGKYLPTMLTDGASLVYGYSEPKDYAAAAVITVFTAVLLFAVSLPVFNKKQL